MSSIAADPPKAETPDYDPNPQGTPNPVFRALKGIASLKLTVFLFVCSIILVFFGTMAQVRNGIWTVVDQYFWSWFVWVDAQSIVDFWKVFGEKIVPISPETRVPTITLPESMHSAFGTKIPLGFPFIGGKLLGFLMLFNLMAAHAVRFKLSWKRAGVWVTHLGLIFLFFGEFGTRVGQLEQQMVITQGESANYAFDTRSYELAFTDHSGSKNDKVIVIPATMLEKAARSRSTITSPELPVAVRVDRYFVNSKMVDPKPGENPATTGIGLEVSAIDAPEVSGVDTSAGIDVPAAYVTFLKPGTEESLGTYLVSMRFSLMDQEPRQTVKVDGKELDISLRNTRYYKPYTMTLEEFRFDRYIGTDKAKNYSSRVRVNDPERGSESEAVISMNNPLYYRGETFYQSNFDKETEKTTVLQVVRNPVWWLPYVACVMIAGGMLGHFGIYLVLFVLRTGGSLSVVKKDPTATPKAATIDELPPHRSLAEVIFPWAVFAFTAIYLMMQMVPRPTGGKIDLQQLARVPVVEGGRVKPLDTVARVNLRLLNHKESVLDKNGNERPAIQWFMDIASSTRQSPGDAMHFRMFRIENDQVLEVLDLKRRDGLRYSLEEILSGQVNNKRRYDVLRDEAIKANKVEAKKRNVYDNKILELWKFVGTYHEIWQGELPMLLPPDEARGLPWRTLATADQQVSQSVFAALTKAAGRRLTLEEMQAMPKAEQERLMEMAEQAKDEAEKADPAAAAWRKVLTTYRDGSESKFKEALKEYDDIVGVSLPSADVNRARFEAFLNSFAPTWHCISLYAFAIALCAGGWIGLAVRPGIGDSFRRAAFWVLVLTFLVHTFALVTRMYLMDRPFVFVTNLYSSAVYIGWAAVLLGLIIEALIPIGIGNFVGAVLGFLTSIIAHNLAASGDTLEMMQAVLDTNFWLATHVTCVSLGYSATYFAGLIGFIYIALGLMTPALRSEVRLGSGATKRTVQLGKLIGSVMYGIVCLATLLSFTGTVLGGIWADFSWGRFWGWDPKENGAVLIVVWNALILHARWAGLVKDRGTAVLTLVGNMITTWSWFGTNQLGVGLHAYGFDNTLAWRCMLTWIAHLALIGVGMVPLHYWQSFSKSKPA